MLQVGLFEEIFQRLGVIARPKVPGKLFKDRLQPLGAHTSNRPCGLSVPPDFLSLEIKMADFFKVVIFCPHPIEGHKMIIRVTLFEDSSQLDCG